VAVHTEMCLEQYETRFAPHRTPEQNKIARLALLYHDVGKPAAEEVVESETRGTYRRYAGHEQDSAVAFTEHWLTDPLLRELLEPFEARQVRWIIEHHLPYGFKDSKKRSDLRTAILHTLREHEETFYDCLRSDAAGRISDDHATKLQNVEDWISEFRTVPLTVNRYDVSKGKCYVMIGPSGTGKSTWTRRYKGEDDYTLSLDALRYNFWHSCNEGHLAPVGTKEMYRVVVEYSFEHDREFRAFVSERINFAFNESLKAKPFRSVFLDNTNLSKKVRAQYIQAARGAGLKVIAVEFWNTLETLAARQKTRPDKEVPLTALKQQHFAQTCAWLGSEVDAVIVVPSVEEDVEQDT
jgi:predicted kinase